MRFANFFQSLFSWMLATLVVCVGLVIFFVYERGDEELRAYIEKTVSERFPSISFSLGSAQLIPGEGIRLTKVSIAGPQSDQGQFGTELAYCEEVLIVCDTSLNRLLDRKLTVKHVDLRELTVNAVRGRNGAWNLAQMIPPQAAADLAIPNVRLQDATIQVLDVVRGNTLALEQIDADFAHDEKAQLFTLQGRCQSDAFNEATFQAGISSVQPRQWNANGTVRRIDCERLTSEPFVASFVTLPPDITGLTGNADVQFTCESNGVNNGPRFNVQAQFQGRCETAKLSHPISEIRMPHIQIAGDPRSMRWVVKDASANFGDSRIMVSANGPELSLSSDLILDFQAANFDLTPEIVRVFPPKLQAIWEKYRPLGVGDIALKSIRQNGKWLTNANVRCHDISLLCLHARYPLTRCHGTMAFRQNVDLSVDLWAAPDRMWKTNPIHITANVLKPGPNFTGVIDVVMADGTWLPLDERVYAAVPPNVSSVLKDMEAQGKLTLRSRMWRDSQDQAEISKQTTIRVQGGSVRHKDFPYPLQNVSGEVHLENNLCRFEKFAAQNDSCIVTCRGSWNSVPAQPDSGLPASSELQLEFVANDIPCDRELREALPSGPRRVWQSLRPAGTIDHAAIRLSHRSGMAKPDIGIVVTQLGTKNDPDRRSLEVQPDWFPLDMDRVTGVVEFRPDGSFSLKNIQAEHGSLQRVVRLRTAGGGVFHENGNWQIQLDRVIADRVETTPELLAAFPKNLGDALRSLKFNGKLFVNARDVRVSGTSDLNTPIEAAWNSTIDVDNGDFVLAGHPIKNLFGEVSLTGFQKNGEVTNYGRVSVDSLICKDIQIKKLRSPWYMDKSRLVYGSAANERDFAVAEVFGGTGQATGQVAFTDDFDFSFDLALRDFDAKQLSRDLKMPAQFSGKGQANLRLQGNSQGTHTYRGSGGIRLSEANLAELPSLIKLVNNLRLRSRPDVFTDSNIDFRIDGATAYLDHFDLHGGSLSLKGNGWVTLDRRLDLQFHALLGGEENYLPIMRPLASRTSKNLYQILVSGTVDNLKWTRKPLPAMNEFLEQPAIGNPRAANTIRLR